MGVVYKAVQFSLERPVALKLLRAGLGAEAGERARFGAEGLDIEVLVTDHLGKRSLGGRKGTKPIYRTEAKEHRHSLWTRSSRRQEKERLSVVGPDCSQTAGTAARCFPRRMRAESMPS